MEIQQKKEYLKSYKDAVIAAKVIQEEIDELRLDKMYPSVISDGMPHASTCSDLSSYAAKLMELEEKLVAARYRRIKLYTDILDRIEGMQDEKEKNVLRLKYLHCKNWDEVAKYTGYTSRQVYRIHLIAINNFMMS